MGEPGNRVMEGNRLDPGHEPGEPDTVWQGLLDGRFSLVEQFERNGRRYLVARRNEPPGPALTLRERKIVAWAARGYSNPEIAFEMDSNELAIAAHLAAAAGKLGLGSRKALVEAASAFVDVDPGLDAPA